MKNYQSVNSFILSLLVLLPLSSQAIEVLRCNFEGKAQSKKATRTKGPFSNPLKTPEFLISDFLPSEQRIFLKDQKGDTNVLGIIEFEVSIKGLKINRYVEEIDLFEFEGSFEETNLFSSLIEGKVYSGELACEKFHSPYLLSTKYVDWIYDNNGKYLDSTKKNFDRYIPFPDCFSGDVHSAALAVQKMLYENNTPKENEGVSVFVSNDSIIKSEKYYSCIQEVQYDPENSECVAWSKELSTYTKKINRCR